MTVTTFPFLAFLNGRTANGKVVTVTLSPIEPAVKRQSRIQFGNLKAILNKLQELQVDDDGRGLILGYSPANEEVTIVDRQLLLYRRFSTVKWPWEDLIREAELEGGQLDAE